LKFSIWGEVAVSTTPEYDLSIIPGAIVHKRLAQVEFEISYGGGAVEMDPLATALVGQPT